jgi:hypothetical protein
MVARLVPVFEVRPPAYVLPGIRVDADRRVTLGRPGREQVRFRVPEGAVIRDRLVTRMPVDGDDVAAVVAIRDFSGLDRGTYVLAEPIDEDVIWAYVMTGDVETLYRAITPASPRTLAAAADRYGGEWLVLAGPWEAYDIVRLNRLGNAPATVLRLIVTEEQVELVNVMVYLRQRDAWVRQ